MVRDLYGGEYKTTDFSQLAAGKFTILSNNRKNRQKLISANIYCKATELAGRQKRCINKRPQMHTEKAPPGGKIYLTKMLIF